MGRGPRGIHGINLAEKGRPAEASRDANAGDPFNSAIDDSRAVDDNAWQSIAT